MSRVRGDAVLGALRGVTLAGSVAAALAWSAPVAAHVPCCRQCVNPHGETIPHAGTADPCFESTIANAGGVNPDGFFLVGTTGDNGVCGAGDLPVTLFSCTSVIDENGKLTCAPGASTEITALGPSTDIKYTEANGVTDPKVRSMGSNNGSKNPNGGAVTLHIIASGDLEVCPADANPQDPNCVLCLVPPPPK
jgi:hypothetical protein